MAKVKVNAEVEGLLSVEDAAEALGRSRMTLYRWIKKGKIISFRFNGRTLIPNVEIERLRSKV